MPSRSRALWRTIGTLAILAAIGCSSSPPEGTAGGDASDSSGTAVTGTGGDTGRGAVSSTGNGATGGGSGGSTTAAGTSTGASTISSHLRFDAGSGGPFGPVAIAAGAGEGELFFSEATADAGSEYFLQHLTPAGIASQSWVKVGSGSPTAPPKVAVSSDGTEVTCCWEDYGAISGSNTKGEVVRCDTVPSRGTAPDSSLHGGFSDLGGKPSLAQSSSTTAAAYTETRDEFITEAVLNLGTPEPNNLQGAFAIDDWHLAPNEGSFNLFLGDGTTIYVATWGHELEADGGVSPTGLSGTGSFAVASNSGLTLGVLTALIAHQGSQVVAEIYGLRVPPKFTLSAAGETPVDPVAAAACGAETFGLAYGLSGGKVVFRTLDAAAGTGPERVIDTGFDSDVTSLEMTVVGGNALIAAGTAKEIRVFAVPCA